MRPPWSVLVPSDPFVFCSNAIWRYRSTSWNGACRAIQSEVLRFGLILFVSVGAGAALADPSGLWRDKDGGTIRIRACGPGYCAAIASVNPALDPSTGKPWTDKNNADASQRNRPLVGVPVLMSMQPSGPGKWSGQLYDADRGRIFTGHLVEINADTIRIEGCVLGICGGETLSRISR